MARCGVLILEATPFSLEDYKPRLELLQGVASLAKETVNGLVPDLIYSGCNLSAGTINTGMRTLEEKGYTPNLIIASAKSNADMRMWGRNISYEYSLPHTIATGYTRSVFGVDVYLDYTLPFGVTIVCSSILDRNVVSDWAFVKIQTV